MDVSWTLTLLEPGFELCASHRLKIKSCCGQYESSSVKVGEKVEIFLKVLPWIAFRRIVDGISVMVKFPWQCSLVLNLPASSASDQQKSGRVHADGVRWPKLFPHWALWNDQSGEIWVGWLLALSTNLYCLTKNARWYHKDNDATMNKCLKHVYLFFVLFSDEMKGVSKCGNALSVITGSKTPMIWGNT